MSGPGGRKIERTADLQRVERKLRENEIQEGRGRAGDEQEELLLLNDVDGADLHSIRERKRKE